MPSLDAVSRDLRFAIRSLGRSPGFAVAAVAVLAAGIGLTVALFTVSNAILRHPLPIADESQVVVLWGGSDGSVRQLPLTADHFDRYRTQARMLSGVAGTLSSTGWPHAVRDGVRPLTLSLAHVTGNFFNVLGSAPVLGRALQPRDDTPGAAPVAVISDALWRRAFAGRADAIGRRLTVPARNLTYTVVGVAAPGLEFPIGADVWVPLSGIHIPEVVPIGRLAPGATVAQAAAELGASFRHEPSADMRQLRGAALPVAEYIVGDVKPALLLLSGAAALLLAIACINVANLLLIRSSSRARDTAIRRALGAGRGHIIRHGLIESALIALAAGLLGTGLAAALVQLLLAMAPPDLPRLDEVRLNGLPIGMAVLVTLATVVFFGVGPAIRAAIDVAPSLRTSDRTATASRTARLAQDALVTVQVTLAIVVLAAAGLLGRSLLRLEQTKTGFSTERLTVVELSWPPDKFASPAKIETLYEQLIPRIEALPGVSAAVPVNVRPFTGAAVGWDGWFQPEGQSEQASHPVFSMAVVGARYFRTLGVPLIRGRDFTDADREGAPHVVVVSEGVARLFWPDESPIGKRIALGGAKADDWWTVVGIVADTRYRVLRGHAATVYMPLRQMGAASTMITTIIVRTDAETAATLPVLQSAARDIDPDVAILSADRMQQLVLNQLKEPRLSVLLLGVFGVGALLLASVGLYATLAYVVRQRRRELAIRQALGASPWRVRMLLLKQALLVAAMGAGLGLTIAIPAGRLIESLLFEISPADPWTLATATGVLVMAMLAASYLPIRRATRADVALLLRVD